MIKYLDELKREDLEGKRVLLRLDLNVPVIDGVVGDATRLERIIPTVDFLRDAGAQTIIISHIEDSFGDATTLLPVFDYLKGYFPVDFCATYFSPEAVDKVLKLEDKGVLLFENLRTNKGEKDNDPEFVQKLSQMADIYVNDAFGASHRKHASIVGVPEFLPKYAGLLMRQEIENISKVFTPKHPFVFILGGAKFETKLPLIKKYLEKADRVFVGGALSNTIFKKRGYEMGQSLVSKVDCKIEDILDNPKLSVPIDLTVTNGKSKESIKNPDSIKETDCVVDAGPETLKELEVLLDGSKTIVWNGPLGNYEIGFKENTEKLAKMIAKATADGAESVVGGGDTLASINALGLEHKLSFISTGGGAMLDYLVNETLPGIEALDN